MQQELAKKLAVADSVQASRARDQTERWSLAVLRLGEEAAGLRQLAAATRAEVAAAAEELSGLGAQCLGRLEELQQMEQCVRELGLGGIRALRDEAAQARCGAAGSCRAEGIARVQGGWHVEGVKM